MAPLKQIGVIVRIINMHLNKPPLSPNTPSNRGKSFTEIIQTKTKPARIVAAHHGDTCGNARSLTLLKGLQTPVRLLAETFHKPISSHGAE